MIAFGFAGLATLVVLVALIYRASLPAHPECRRRDHDWDRLNADDFGDIRTCKRCGEREKWVPDAGGWTDGQWEKRSQHDGSK